MKQFNYKKFLKENRLTPSSTLATLNEDRVQTYSIKVSPGDPLADEELAFIIPGFDENQIYDYDIRVEAEIEIADSEKGDDETPPVPERIYNVDLIDWEFVNPELNQNRDVYNKVKQFVEEYKVDFEEHIKEAAIQDLL